MVPLIAGMNNEPCHPTASGEGLSGEGQVSSKYRHELLGAATYKPVVFSKFVNGVYNIKVWPRFWEVFRPNPSFSSGRLPADIISRRSGPWLCAGFASFFNNPTDSVTCLSRDGRVPEDSLGPGFVGEASVREEGRKRALGTH